MVLLSSLGIDVETIWNKRHVDGAVMSRMIFSENKGGVLNAVHHNLIETDPTILGFQIFAKEGDVIHRFENSSHCVGQLTVKAPTVEECKNISDNFISSIDIDLS